MFGFGKKDSSKEYQVKVSIGESIIEVKAPTQNEVLGLYLVLTGQGRIKVHSPIQEAIV
jgi:hypothetical protein